MPIKKKKMVKKVAKKVVKKVAKKTSVKKAPASAKASARQAKPIGVVKHYFGNLGVGIIKLAAPIKVGDSIRISGGEKTDFIQEVKSLQIDHEEVKKAAKGKVVGLKIKEIARQGYKVFKA